MEDEGFDMRIDCDCRPGSEFGPWGRAMVDLRLDGRSAWVLHAWLGRGCVDRLVIDRDGLDLVPAEKAPGADDGAQKRLDDFGGERRCPRCTG